MNLSFVTRILSFNPTSLLNQTFRTRWLLKNPEVIRMLRLAYNFGEQHQICENLDPVRKEDFSFDQMLLELER